jgi:hypothetical protein
MKDTGARGAISPHSLIDFDYIISNDKKAYKGSFIERLSPSEYLQR